MWWKADGRWAAAWVFLPEIDRLRLNWLILTAWQQGGLTDPKMAARFAGLPEDAVTALWAEFIAVCEEKNGRWMLPQMWESLEGQAERIAKAKKAGQASAEARLTQTKELPPTTSQLQVNPTSTKSNSGQPDKNRVEKNRREKKRKSIPEPAAQDTDAPAPAAKETASRKKQSDPRLEHFGVVAYRNRAHLTPNETQRDLIVGKVTDSALWEIILQGWFGHGWSPLNVTGMVEAYEKGGIGNGSAAGANNGRANTNQSSGSQESTYTWQSRGKVGEKS